MALWHLNRVKTVLLYQVSLGVQLVDESANLVARRLRAVVVACMCVEQVADLHQFPPLS
jgi:hypothetical protein